MPDSPPPRLVAVAGSLRKTSFNRGLLRYAVEGAESAGAEVDCVAPEGLDMPFYNADLEHDGRYPKEVERWRRRIVGCAGLLIASPEYNHDLSAVLKNALDWASRPPNALRGKVAATFGTTPGPFGAARSQMTLHQALMALGVWVVPRTVLVPHARQAFDADGNLTSGQLVADLRALGAALAAAIRAGIGQL